MALQHEYPIPPSELLEILLDLEYLQARHERFRGVGTPAVERGEAKVSVTTIRQLPMDKIPGAFRGFVGDGQITQVDTWHLPEAGEAVVVLGDWRAELPSAPARMGGEHHIEANDDGSTYDITVDVSIKVPLVGGKMEGQVRGYLEHLIGKEQAYLADWVAGL
jgi:hypothetical protein